MTVYVHECYLTADDPAEAAAMAAQLQLPADRLRMEGTPRWHWLVEPGDREWAVTAGAQEVDVDVFRQLVLHRRMAEAVAAANSGGPMPAGVIACGPKPRPPAKWNPQLRRHRWVRDPVVHQRHCDWCGIVTENRPVPKSAVWYKAWRWPGSLNEWDGTTRDPDADGKVPTCPGPGGAPAPKPPVPPKPEQGTLC